MERFNQMPKEKCMPEGEKNISELEKKIQIKVANMKESEGTEAEFSDVDLDYINGGKSASWEVSYKT
jgi:hypothetical protein